jgi:MoxR-like ATPase
MMRQIIAVHYPALSEDLAQACLSAFYRLRRLDGIEKKPATRELLNWIRALEQDDDFRPEDLTKKQMPYLGVLFKKSEDLERVAHLLSS